MTPEEFKKRWNDRTPLVRFDPEAVMKTNIPESTKQFLIEAGLPEDFYGFTMSRDLPRLPSALQKKRSLPPSFDRYRLIGDRHFSECYDCIDEEGDGRIVQVVTWKEGGPELYFVNSSIQQFAACLLAWKDFWVTLYSGDVADIGELEDKIRASDPVALEGEQCDWYLEIARLSRGNFF